MLSEFQRPAAVEKLEQVAFMRLVPRNLHRGDGAEVQAVDQRRFEQARAESRVLRDGGDYQGRSDLAEHSRLRNLHNARVGTKEFPVGQRVGERIAEHDGGTQIRGAFEGCLTSRFKPETHCNACSKSPTKSSAFSNPTEIRSKFCGVPVFGPSTDARCSIKLCVPPRLVARVKSRTFAATCIARSRPPRNCNDSMPPNPAIWRAATACPGWPARPG